MKIFFRIIKLLIKPRYLARFIIVLYRLKESKIKIENPARVCMYKISCSRYAFRTFKYHNFFYGIYLSWIRYYSCTPERYNRKLDVD